MLQLRSKQVAWLSRALGLGLDTGRLQEGKWREGKAGELGGGVTSLTSPLPGAGWTVKVWGALTAIPWSRPRPMGTSWMTTGKSPASGALAHLPLTSAGSKDTGEEAGTGGRD